MDHAEGSTGRSERRISPARPPGATFGPEIDAEADLAQSRERRPAPATTIRALEGRAEHTARAERSPKAR